MIETSITVNTSEPRVAVDLAGNATAIWRTWEAPFSFGLYANRFDPGRGWGTEESIITSPGELYGHQVAVDDLGNAIAVWFQWNGSSYNIYRNRFVPAGGWGVPGWIGGSGGDPHVAMDGEGGAIVVWRGGGVYATRFVPATGWGTPERIGGNADATHPEPKVAFDGMGNAIAIWAEDDGITIRVWSNRYVAGVGWGTPVLLGGNPGPAGIEAGARVAVDRGGNATAVWRQVNGVWAARFTPNKGWGRPDLLGGVWAAGEPRVAIDSRGNAIAVWAELREGESTANVWSNRYVPGVGWGTAQLLEQAAGDVGYLNIAMDSRGNAIATWSQIDGQRVHVFSNRYIADVGWQGPVRVSTGACNAFDASIGMDGAGNAVVVWAECTGDPPRAPFNIWASRYVVGDGAPRLILTSPSEALTNDPTVTVAGQTDPGAIVKIDGAPVAVDRQGNFRRTVTLSEGTHTFVVVAENLAGNRRTATATMTVDTTGPPLSVLTPANGSTLEVPVVTVSGATEPGARVAVNGILVDAGNGTFSVEIALQPGENEIVVTATDAAGNTATRSVRVTFVDPLPSLRAQLSMLATLLAISIVVAAAGFGALYWRLQTRRRKRQSLPEAPGPEGGTHR